ncbi:MAG: protein kinase [Anaerolineales bacterium]|nr:protein kinase [Anaerolineales bacterium]
MAALIGKTAGKYTLLELLGRGGMAEVYKARHPTLDRYVTVKILHRHLADGEGFLVRFEREAKAVATMRHPHIVQIYDYEAAEDANYMVMEYIDGGTLQDRVFTLAKEKKYLPVREALAILGQVAEALDYAHERGILHRDVKPSNILLDSSGEAYLTDFGIARILSGAQYTATGVMIGTPAYMSPEQGTGEEITASSDLYSLGVIAYELLAGKVPFSSETTPLAVIHKHIHEPPPGLRAARENLPAGAEDAVWRALAKKPADRFTSAGEFVRALEKALPDSVLRAIDGEGGKNPVPVSTQPTMVMEEPALGRSQMPTEVMESAPQSAEPPPATGSPTPARAPLQPAPREAGMPERQARFSDAALPHKAPPESKSVIASACGFFKTRGGRIAVVTVAVVMVLAVVGWLFSGRSAALFCGSVEQCIAQAQDLRTQGDLEGFVNLMRAAADRVPGEQHPPHAGIWCDIGDAERELGRPDAARESYNQCLEWTENLPEFQDLRLRAEEALRGL